MSEKHIMRGVVAGIAGGLVASWVMNQFIAGPGMKLQRAAQSPFENVEQKEHKDDPDSTMKVADAVASVATGGQHLTLQQQKSAGPLVHYAFGALMGGLYGGAAELVPSVKGGFGTTFGSALFAGADLVAVPALDLAPPATEEPLPAIGNHYAAHLVYGATTELVRRIVRAML